MNTSLVRLSKTALILVLVMMVMLVIGAGYLLSRVEQTQREVAEILDLQRRISAFSAAADALLLQGADPVLLNAVRRDARAIEAELEALGEEYPAAMNGVRAIDRMVQMLEAAGSVRRQARVIGSPEGPPLTESLFSTMAAHGIALDAAVGEALEARRQGIATQTSWLFGGLSGFSVLFAAVSFGAFSMLYWRVGVPLGRLAATIRAIEDGDTSARAAENRSDELGEVAKAFNSLITRRQAAESSLQKTSALVRMASAVADFGGWRYDPERDRVEWTDGTARIHDLPPGTSPRSQDALAFYPEGERQRISRRVEACLAHGRSFDDTFRLVTAAGRQLTVRAVGEPEYGGTGRIVAVQGAFQDVSELIQVREQIARRSAQLRDVLSAIGDGFFTLDAEWRFTFINQRAQELVGRAGDELTGQSMWEAFPEMRGTRFESLCQRAVRTGESQLFTEYLPTVERWFEANAHPTPDGLAVYFRDCTAQRETQERLKLFEKATERLNDMIVITEAGEVDGPDHPRILYVNTAFERITGYTRDEAIGNTPRMLQGPATDRTALDEIRAALEARRSVRTEIVNYTKSGTPCWLELDIVPLMDPDGRNTHFVAVQRDVTERKRAEERIREDEERLRLVSQVTTDFIWDWDVRKDEWTRSDAYLERLGLSAPEAPRTSFESVGLIHPEDRDRVVKELQDAVTGDAGSWESEYRILDKDDAVRQVEVRAAIVRDDEGNATRVVGGMSDVTELRALDQQLHEAQKLESIGQLTGGVAHDFNNLLTIILGNADMLLEQAADDTTRKLAETTLDAAERGARLTDSLLTFARRQPLRPEATDVNALIDGASTLLRKSVEEGIDLLFDLGAEAPVVNIDANRLQAAILNLVINSKLAIGERGTITVETADAILDEAYVSQHPGLSAGAYLCVAVTDDGSGMAPDIVERAFDPFFTTRPPGQGTGLGLSSVYGFVKQSGGHARIYSEPGLGTTVRLYLPVVHDDSAAREQDTAPADVKGRGEHILVVEDDDSLRANVTSQLKGLRYRVSAASDAEEALRILDATPDIDLLFTDIVMPGRMNGRELAQEAQRRRVGLPVLFTSGYSRHAIVRNGKLEEGLNLLGKPYRLADLARAVRHALSAPPPE